MVSTDHDRGWSIVRSEAYLLSRRSSRLSSRRSSRLSRSRSRSQSLLGGDRALPSKRSSLLGGGDLGLPSNLSSRLGDLARPSKRSSLPIGGGGDLLLERLLLIGPGLLLLIGKCAGGGGDLDLDLLGPSPPRLGPPNGGDLDRLRGTYRPPGT